MMIKPKVLSLLLGCVATFSSCQEELLPEGLIQQAESSVGIPTTRAEIDQAQDWYGENHPEKAFAEVPAKEGARIGPGHLWEFLTGMQQAM